MQDDLDQPEHAADAAAPLGELQRKLLTEPGLAEKLRMRLGSLMGKADDASAPRPRSSFHDT